MTLSDAIQYFTQETHIMPCLAVACGSAHSHVQARGDTPEQRLHAGSLFDLASLTKLFTGLMVMRLHEEGLLDLHAPITRYAPQFNHLASTTVNSVLGFETALTTPERVDTQTTPEAGLRQLYDVRPGVVTGRAYSDMHAMVLRCVIEGAAQCSYEQAVQDRILAPLAMQDTFCMVPQERRGDCISYTGEHRIERGRFIRHDTPLGIPHDPKAQRLYPVCCGHAGLFSTLDDMRRLCQGLLQGQIISREGLVAMSRNRTGCRRGDGSYQQYLGAQCYVKHPRQYDSEIPVYESDKAIGLSGFTGHHLSVDVETGVFALFLGNRVLNRLTVLIPGDAASRQAYGLNPDGTGLVHWPGGSQRWSSVDYVHHKDAHFHQAVADTLGLDRWHRPGSDWP